MPGKVLSAEIDDMLMIEPVAGLSPAALRIRPTAACIPRNAPSVLTAMTRRKSSSEVSIMVFAR